MVNDNRTSITFFSPQINQQINVDEYEVAVHDITGWQKFNKSIKSTSSNTYTCVIPYSILNGQPECAPYIVSVKALNSFGFSNENITIIDQQGQEDVCLCLTKNGKHLYNNYYFYGFLS